MIGRREFIALLSGAAAARPLAARAQQQAMPVIGLLSGASADPSTDRLRALRDGLGATGYVEGRNVAIEYRWADGRNDQLRTMAADLVHRRVKVIVAGGIPAAQAAMAETSTIPIVFSIGDDPVKVGLVASLNRPAGNVTGVTTLNVEVGPKRLELLHEMVPALTRVAVLLNPSNPNAHNLSIGLAAAASALGVNLHMLQASTDQEIDVALAVAAGARAMVIGTDPFFNARSKRLATLALRLHLPVVYQFREFVAAGGLASYGGSPSDTYRHTGTYAGRILNGDHPADLPVQQGTKVELILNLKTAKALGLEVPPTLLARADEVIE